MNATAARERDDVDLAERVECLEALVGVLSSRVSELEGNAVEPMDDEPVTTIKGAAWLSGYSETTIRKRIKRGLIDARPVGGRWLVRKASLPARRG